MLYMVDLEKMDMFNQYWRALKIKYTHSGVLSSALAMDKITSKEIFKKNKILTPKYLKYINHDTNKKNIKKKLKKN